MTNETASVHIKLCDKRIGLTRENLYSLIEDLGPDSDVMVKTIASMLTSSTLCDTWLYQDDLETIDGVCESEHGIRSIGETVWTEEGTKIGINVERVVETTLNTVSTLIADKIEELFEEETEEAANDA